MDGGVGGGECVFVRVLQSLAIKATTLNGKQSFGSTMCLRERRNAVPRCKGETFAIVNNPNDGEPEGAMRLWSINIAHL